MQQLKNLFFIFPVMFYYIFESLIIGLFVNLIWQYMFMPITNIQIDYIHIVAIIWVIKIVIFNVFSLITGLGTIIPEVVDEEVDNVPNYDNDYTN